MFDLQDSISTKVAQVLAPHLGQKARHRLAGAGGTRNVDACQLYLTARQTGPGHQDRGPRQEHRSVPAGDCAGPRLCAGLRLARESDPLSLILLTLESGSLLGAGRVQEAHQRLQRVFDIEPDFWVAHMVQAAMPFDSLGPTSSMATRREDKRSTTARSLSSVP
ncbi:MAG: hypothetical protein ABIN96_15170, partial [Rubrivivax sp.]